MSIRYQYLTVYAVIILSVCFAGAGCRGKMLAPKPPLNLYKITAANLHGVSTVGIDNIWIVGGYGAIYHSGDGGKNWTRQTSGVDDLLCSVNFVDEKTGWASGIYGTMVHTEDGGTTWVRQNPGTDNHLFKIQFLNKNLGWAIGNMGTILHTVDSGKTWSSQREPEDINLHDVCFVDENNGWVAGEFGRILYTSDGGKTWVQQKPQALFANENDQWADTPLALYGVKFIDTQRGWVAGMDGILLMTEDGGKTWSDLRSTHTMKSPLYAVDIKGNRGWAVGDAGNYLLSEDGGKHWELMDGKIKTRFWLHGISFSTNETGWVVGARGAVVKTSDGGTSWTMLSGLTYDVPEFGLADF